ncbi:Asparagine-rich protein [Paragonimus kellicotti]|nr:Asparagine-rich protein [Paragonimus kellicotti]
MTTNKQECPLTTGMEEEWLQASEARYDSMRNLLQSVKHDIDALTSKIDRTHASPTLERATRFGEEPKRSSPFVNMQNDRKDNQEGILHPFCTDSGTQLYPTNSDAEKALKDLSEGDEYMEIKIREAKQHFPLYGSEDQLLDCTIATSHRKPDHEEGKTWRSPSDFNLHDPFDEDIIQQEFRKEIRPCLMETHRHQAMKETDLDDLKSDSYVHEVDSDRSISPAVSPTFEICANENVHLSNMLITKDETGHFQFNSNDVNGKANHVEYQVCDNEHALTTIDEASEEIEDDWSSSDLDASVGNNEYVKSNRLTASADHVSQSLSATLPNQSIKAEFKTLSDFTLIPLTVHTGEDDATQAASRKLKSCSTKNVVGTESGYPVASTNAYTGQKVWLRPKRTETEFGSPVKQRPISAGSLRAHLRSADSSMPGSIHSISSTFSQESVISEADSYVTVNSRFGTTGSDEVYITACSDSEVHLQSPVQPPYRQDDEDCSTLSRRRTKLPRNQRHRTKDLVPIGDSSSDEELDETLIRSEAIVVTPKFSRLPSKITSPNESISVIRYSTYPYEEKLQTSQAGELTHSFVSRKCGYHSIR